MRTKIYIAFAMVPVLVALFVLFLVIKKHNSPPQIANNTVESSLSSEKPKVEILSANVFVKSQGSKEWSAATEGEDLKAGDSIKTDTDGKAQIIYPSGTVTRLDSNTEITLKDYEASPQQVDILVESGKIWSRITKLLGGETYQSESKNLIASVRGTVYIHEVLPSGEDKISALSHTVHINCGKTQVETDISENLETETNCKEKPSLARIPQSEKLSSFVKLSVEEDKKLIERFRNAKYDDADIATPEATIAPALTPSPIPTLAPLSITSVTLICGATISTSPYYPCGDGHTKIEVKGNGFTQGMTVWAVPVQTSTPQALTYIPPSPTPIESDNTTSTETWPNIINSTDLIAHFSALLHGTFYARVVLGNQVVDYPSVPFTTY